MTMEPPDNSGFSYGLWTPGTRLQLCRVPWASDYRDIAYFASNEDLNRYLNNSSHGGSIEIQGAVPIYPGRPVKVPLPLSDVQSYNYLRVWNPALPGTWSVGITDRDNEFYYFINDSQFVARDTTSLAIQLDVWQTYGRRVKFGNAFIERGHIGIANENCFENYGRSYLTQPEGLDLGSEYWINDTILYQISQPAEPVNVLVVSTLDLEHSGGDVNNPIIQSANGGTFETVPHGCDVYLIEQNNVRSLMTSLSKMPWVSSGIIAMYAIPKNLLGDAYFAGHNVTIAGQVPAKIVTAQSAYEGRIQRTIDRNFRDRIEPRGRYRHLKKFSTYPYTVLEITTNTGSPIILKPECVDGPDIKVNQLAKVTPPGSRVAFYPHRYNANPAKGMVLGTEDQPLIDCGEFLDMATYIADIPSGMIVNDGYLNYLASNKNQIAYAQQSAAWTQSKADRGARIAYDQASQSIEGAINSTAVQNNAATAQTQLANQTAGLNAVSGVIQGIAGGARAGGLAGAAAGGALSALGGGLDYAIGSHQRTQSTAISNAANAQLTGISTGVARYNRDTNYELATWVAKGDYENTIAGINAQVNDAKMTQPTTSGQAGGDAFLMATTGMTITLKYKTLAPDAYNAIASYWWRYGYAVNRFGRMPDDLQVMTNFTYWKLKETYISTATVPEAYKIAIRGIFEKGVTVWRDANNIGNIDIWDNDPIPGVTL